LHEATAEFQTGRDSGTGIKTGFSRNWLKIKRADQASEQGIPIGACGKRNDLLARPPVAAEVLGCFETGGRVQSKGVRGRRRTSPNGAESSQVFGGGLPALNPS